MPNEHDVMVEAQDALSAYEMLKETLEARPAELVRTPTVGLLNAVTAGLLLARLATEDRERIVSALTAPPGAEIDTLRVRALAAWGAQIVLDQLVNAQEPASDVLRKLVPEVTEKRRTFLAAAGYIWHDDDSVQDLLTEIRKGRSYADKANDVTALASLFDARMADVVARTSITAEEVKELARLGTRMLELLHPSGEDEALVAAKLMRDKAYAYLVEAFDEVKAAATYALRRDELRLASYPNLAEFRAAPRKADGPAEVVEA